MIPDLLPEELSSNGTATDPTDNFADDADVLAYEARWAATEAYLTLVGSHHFDVDSAPQVAARRREGGE